MKQIEFEISGVSYRADPLDAFKQLHVSRKIAPTVPKLVPMLVKMQQAGQAGDDLASFAEAAGPFAEALAAMPDAEVEYVVKTCLSVVKRNQAGTWSPLVANGALMFADMDLGQMLPIVARVLRENLGNFIQGLLGKSSGAPAAIPGQVG